MEPFQRLLLENKAWAEEKIAHDSGFFQRQLKQQQPDFLWIGCSDSRVPAEIVVNACIATLPIKSSPRTATA